MRGPYCLPQVSFPLIYSLRIAKQELSLKDTVKVRSGKTYVGLFNMVTRSRTWHENKEEFSAGKSLILVFLFIRLMNVLLCLNPDKSFHDSSCLQLTSLQLTWPAVYQWILTVFQNCSSENSLLPIFWYGEVMEHTDFPDHIIHR